jgi:hypothetical protein
VSGPAEAIERLAEQAAEVGFRRLGRVGGERLAAAGPAATLDLSVAQLVAAFESGIPAKFS